MVTDAVWIDIDQDKNLDLILTNEWGTVELFKNTSGTFVNETKPFGLGEDVGWWNTIKINDVDNDGDLDIIAGNLGLNYKYKASKEEPFHFYLNDFDNNKKEDIVLEYNQNDTLYPLRGRECSSNQMPFIKQKFKTYDAYGKANLKQIYGDKLEEGVHYSATNFANRIFKNIDNKKFEFIPFDNAVQISSINKIIIDDFDNDNKNDLLLFGNFYESEVETPRNDASYGHFFKGDGSGDFKVIPAHKSGLYIKGDVKDAALIFVGSNENKYRALLVAKNNDYLQLIKIK